MDNSTNISNFSTNCSFVSSPQRPSAFVANTVVVFSTLGSAIGLVSIIVNIIFLCSLRLMRGRNHTYLRYIFNISVADVLAATSFLVSQHWPHWLYSYINPQQNFMLSHGIAYFMRGTPWMFFTAYQFTLCCLTYNQYIAVCRSWKYAELMLHNRVTLSLVVVWILSSLQVLIPLLISIVLYTINNKKLAMHLLFTCSNIESHIWMAVFLITIAINMVLEFLAYKKIRNLKLAQRYCSTSRDRRNLDLKQEAFFTLSILLSAAFLCRLPLPLVGIVGLNSDYSSQTILGASAKELADSVVVFILYCNFMVDPIIVLCRTGEMRRTFHEFLLLRCKYYCKSCTRGYAQEEVFAGELVNLGNQRRNTQGANAPTGQNT